MREYGDGRKVYSLRERRNKVSWANFADPATSGRSVSELVDGLPHILAGQDFRRIVVAIAKAYREKRPVIAMLGGHVIKCGLSPVINSLIKKKIITAVAMNGAAAIHDFEMAFFGGTSEDVEENLPIGKFGMWEETGALMAGRYLKGLGGWWAISATYGEYAEYSILANAFKSDIPVTAHISIGCDFIHMHPLADGAAIGRGSLLDFETFTEIIQSLSDGGVVLHFGSAVVLPEILLKALSLAVNKGTKFDSTVFANFDMQMPYRAIKNVVERPRLLGAITYNLTGHHEIMIPLLACAVMDYIEMEEDLL